MEHALGHKQNQFIGALKKFTCCCLKDDLELAGAYYNLGRSLFQNKGYDSDAKFCLEISLQLKEHHVHPSPDDIRKTKSAIAECEARIQSDFRASMGTLTVTDASTASAASSEVLEIHKAPVRFTQAATKSQTASLDTKQRKKNQN